MSVFLVGFRLIHEHKPKYELTPGIYFYIHKKKKKQFIRPAILLLLLLLRCVWRLCWMLTVSHFQVVISNVIKRPPAYTSIIRLLYRMANTIPVFQWFLWSKALQVTGCFINYCHGHIYSKMQPSQSIQYYLNVYTLLGFTIWYWTTNWHAFPQKTLFLLLSEFLRCL